MNPCTAAAFTSDLDVSRLLIAAGAKTEVQARNGTTPFDFAKLMGNKAMMELLWNKQGKKPPSP